jgi:TRAP-type uncharacterized transport system substrate-binding protein
VLGGSCILFLATVVSCDVLYNQKKLRLAVAVNDHASNSSAAYLKTFLESGGYIVDLIPVATAVEANILVANSDADITFVLNHSLSIPVNLGKRSDELRTIMPLLEPAMFIFSKDSSINVTNPDAFRGKKVGVEKLGGEAHMDMQEILNTAKMGSVEFTENWTGDFFYFWGTYNGKRAQNSVSKNWTPLSIDQKMKDLLLRYYPSLVQFTLPAFPGEPDSRPISTLSSQMLLICNASLSERTVYDLAEYIYRHKLALMSYDRMYYSINESFNTAKLLYPLHRGTDAYLRRDEPSFIERYADAIALIITVIVLSLGAVQTLRNFLAARQKVRLQHYFAEYLAISENPEISSEERIKQLNALLRETLTHVTESKLDKDDFHIFSHLIHQELALIKTEPLM